MRSPLALVVAPLLGGAVLLACSAFGGGDDDDDDDDEPAATTLTPPDGGERNDATAPPPPPPDATIDVPGDDGGAACRDVPPRCRPGTCAPSFVRAPLSGFFPFRIVTDATHVFWLEQQQVEGGPLASDGHAVARLVRARKVGGVEPEVLVEGLPRAVALALDGPHVFWGEADGALGRVGWVRKDCAVGACAKQLANGSADAHLERLVAAEPGRLVASTGVGVLFRVDTGAAVPSIAPLGTATGRFPSLGRVDGKTIAGASFFPALVELPASGGAAAFATIPQLPDAPEGSRGVGHSTGDCAQLWGLRELPGGGDFELLRAAGGNVQILSKLTLSRPYALANDADTLYVAMPGRGLLTVRKDTPAVLDLLRPGDVRYLAVDDDGVYLSERGGGGGSIVRLASPP